MRNQHARVVLAACLFAAAAAAQGTKQGSKAVGYEPTGFGIGRFTPAIGGSGGDASANSESWAGLPQQDPYERPAIFAQVHGDFMHRMERYKPLIEVGARVMPNQSVGNEPGNFDEFGYFFDGDFRWNVSTDGYLLFGAYYGGRSYKFQDMGQSQGPGGSLGDEHLLAAGVKLGFGAFLHDGLLLQVETHPGAWTDADAGLHHQDFDFPSHALLTYRVIDNLFVKGGFRYNQVYHDAPWLPLLGISWDITGSGDAGSVDPYRGGWRLDVLLPEHAEVSYWQSDATGWLLGAQISGAEYSVRTSRISGNQRDNLHVQEVVAYLGLVHRLNENFSFSARAGAVLAGDYNLTTGAAGYDRVEGALGQSFWAEVTFGFDF